MQSDITMYWAWCDGWWWTDGMLWRWTSALQ